MRGQQKGYLLVIMQGLSYNAFIHLRYMDDQDTSLRERSTAMLV